MRKGNTTVRKLYVFLTLTF